MKDTRFRIYFLCIFFFLVLPPSVWAFEPVLFKDQILDQNGNVIEDSKFKYEYDSLNKLRKVFDRNDSGRLLEKYAYDEAGIRILKITYNSDGSTIKTLYPDQSFVREIDVNGSHDTVYYQDPAGNVVAKKDSIGTKHYYHNNHLGSVEAVTGETGALEETTEYLPYGDVVHGGTERFLFTGQEKDQATGLNYYKARYYDSGYRRFTRADPIFADFTSDSKIIYDPQQLNKYAYVRNNPLKNIDPEGTTPFSSQGYDPFGFGEILEKISKIFTGASAASVAEKTKGNIETARNTPLDPNKPLDQLTGLNKFQRIEFTSKFIGEASGFTDLNNIALYHMSKGTVLEKEGMKEVAGKSTVDLVTKGIFAVGGEVGGFVGGVCVAADKISTATEAVDVYNEVSGQVNYKSTSKPYPGITSMTAKDDL